MWRTRKHPGSCQECRKRRLKCDETKPHCFKCQKYGRICSGYTDWSELTVRDMTALTISRSQSAQRSSKRDGTSPRGHPPSTPNPDTPKHLGPELGILPGLASPIRLNPSASLNDQARSFLYARFVNETPQTLDPGYHYVLRAIFELEDTGDCLDACVSAAALAAFTTRPDAKGVDIRTHKAYLRALSAINTAIQEPDAAGDDRILASVLMLAFYEIFHSNHLVGYYNHIFGAASMINARKGRDARSRLTPHLYHLVKYELCKTSILGFATPADANLDMYLRWSSNINFTTITQDYSVPEANKESEGDLDGHIRKLMEKMVNDNPIMDMVTREGPPKDLQSAQNLLMAVFAAVKQVVDNHTDIENHVTADLDSRPQRLPRPVQRDQTYPDAYPDAPICVYKKASYASFHIGICLARVSCLSHLVAVTSMAPPVVDLDAMAEYQDLVQQVHEDIAMIVSSVPYACGWTADGLRRPFDGQAGSSDPGEPAATLFMMSFVPWAMIAVVASPLVTEEQKSYLLHMLRYIADVQRIRQAEALLDVTANATTMKSLAHWDRTILRDHGDTIPASWIGKGTSLESEIYQKQQMTVAPTR